MWLRADRSGDGKPQLWRAETQLRRPQTRQLDRSSGDKPQRTNSGGPAFSRLAATFRQPGRFYAAQFWKTRNLRHAPPETLLGARRGPRAAIAIALPVHKEALRGKDLSRREESARAGLPTK